MLNQFIAENNIPISFAAQAKEHFLPLAVKLTSHLSTRSQPMVIGINGCQGSGKSTLTSFLKHVLEKEYALNVINLSLDDFYLSPEDRQLCAKEYHSLLKTRGVPGTHDTALLSSTLAKLKTGLSVKIPRFNKATDEPEPMSQWQTASDHVDSILIVGWCWGVEPQPEADLVNPINQLESLQDPDGSWRQYVNQQLKEHYQPLYQFVDYWIMLKAPSFDCVSQWRWQQEQHLIQESKGEKQSAIMTKAQVIDFISFFQRLTEHALTTLPKQCDLVYFLDKNRQIVSVEGRL